MKDSKFLSDAQKCAVVEAFIRKRHPSPVKEEEIAEIVNRFFIERYCHYLVFQGMLDVDLQDGNLVFQLRKSPAFQNPDWIYIDEEEMKS